jgi:hypothetical protein
MIKWEGEGEGGERQPAARTVLWCGGGHEWRRELAGEGETGPMATKSTSEATGMMRG